MLKRIMLVSVAALLAAGCQTVPDNAPRATANLEPTKGSKVRGTVNFYQVGDKVRVRGGVNNLAPNGEFGFHVHEAGDCSSGDGMSTKGHFNPHGKAHAQHTSAERHAGDLPSLKSDANGYAAVDAEVDIISVTPGP